MDPDPHTQLSNAEPNPPIAEPPKPLPPSEQPPLDKPIIGGVRNPHRMLWLGLAVIVLLIVAVYLLR